MNTNTMSVRSSLNRPAELSALSVGELVCLAIGGADVEASSAGATVASTIAEELELIACAQTDGLALTEHVARAHLARLSARASAFAELVRRLSDAHEEQQAFVPRGVVDTEGAHHFDAE